MGSGGGVAKWDRTLSLWRLFEIATVPQRNRADIAMDDEQLGRGVRELIVAYRRGQDRTDLLCDARDLRYLPENPDHGELPDELLAALFSPRDFDPRYEGEGEPDWETQIHIEIQFPMCLNENHRYVPVASVAYEFAGADGLLSVLFVLDEHLVLILGHTGGGEMLEAGSFVFDRSPEYELSMDVFESTPPTRFNLKSFDWHMTGTGYFEEQAAAFVDDILYIIEKKQKGEKVVAYSRCLPVPVDEGFDPLAGDRFHETFEMIRDGNFAMIRNNDDRAHLLFTHAIHHLYTDILEDFPDRFLPSDWAWSRGMDRSRLGDGITKPRFFRRQSNMARRSPHALIRALVTTDRAIVPQDTGEFADARLYAFLYDAIPAPVFREVVMFL